MTYEYEDASLRDIAVAAEQAIMEGGIVYQKWTCDACNLRVVGENPNRLYTYGKHDDCTVTPGYVTNLKEKGCNIIIIYGFPGKDLDGD